MLERNIAPRLVDISNPHILPYQSVFSDNGTEIIISNDSSLEVFKIDIVFEYGGIEFQPCPLCANTALNMLMEGTNKYTSTEIAELFDFYGAYTDCNCGLRRSEISLICPNKYSTETISMMAEMIKDSIIPEKELSIFLRNKRQEFLVSSEKTSWIARKEFINKFFGAEHPYANIIHESDYTKLSRQDVLAFYTQYLKNARFTIFASGNVNDKIINELKTAFSFTKENVEYPFVQLPIDTKIGTFDFHKDGSVQTSIRIGKSGVNIQEEDYPYFQVLNTILGGYFGSRLMSSIREEKGYTYGISSINVSMANGTSYWCIAGDVNPQFRQATIDACFYEIDKLRTEKVSEEELGLVKRYLNGELLRELDGVFSQSDALKHKMAFGKNNGIYIDIINKINKCNPQIIIDLANKYLNTKDMLIITAGA